MQDFKIWFSTPFPASIMTVAIHFSFNQTLPRGQEGLTPLRVIEIMAPEGIQLKVRRPKDVQRLKRENYVVGSPGHLKDKQYDSKVGCRTYNRPMSDLTSQVSLHPLHFDNL